MILFDLKCVNDHVFEAWFRDNATFDKQRRAREIACPVCADVKIEKAPMAPNIAIGGAESVATPAKAAAETVEAAKMIGALRALREEVEKNSDYVGPRFAEEARKIHYGETEKRSIYGEASDRDTRELHDEGVRITTIPWISRTDS